MARGKPLVMVIDGNVDGLKTAARAASNVLTELEGDMVATRDQLIGAFDKIANVSQAAMDRMAKGIRSEFTRMSREAEQAARSGADFNPVAGFSSESQQRFADNNRKLAAQIMQQETALRGLAAAGGEMSAKYTAMANESLLYSKSLTLEADAAERVADDLRKIETAMAGTATATGELGAAQGQVAGQSRAFGAGMQQAGFQVSDFFVQVGGGTSAVRAASQQLPQLTQAIALMGSGSDGAKGKFGAFATFLAGPWGAAITVGVSILGVLATKLLESGDAAGKAEDEAYDFSRGLDVIALSADKAKNALGQLEQQIRSTIRTQGDFLRRDAEIANKSVSDLETNIAQDQAEVARLRRGLNPIPSFQGGDLRKIAEIERRIEDNLAKLPAAQTAAAAAAVAVGQRNVEERNSPAQARINQIDAEIGALIERRTTSVRDKDILADTYITQESFEKELGRLTKLREAAEKAKRDAERSNELQGPSASAQASVGDMTALLQQMLPGVKITSTTGGKHVKGSDHYAGRAIDFVVPGGMTPAMYEQIEAMLGEAGVSIRRNASGKKQFFGPGNPAAKPGDHDDHFHLAWEGKASPEAAERLAERRNQEAQRNREALESAMLASKQDAARLARLGVTDAAKLAELDLAAIDAGLARKLAQNAKLELDHSELDALDTANAETEKRAVTEKLRADLAAKALDEERRQIGVAAQLIELEGQLATSTREKMRVADQLLDLRYQDEKKAAEQQYAKDGDFEAYLDNVGIAQTRRDTDRTLLGREYRGATGDYMAELHANVSDMDEAFDGVAARGLQSLEDGLVGLITGTEDVATAFKRMAASIIADLARIAVQKLILSAFGIGFADGDVPKFASGLISGPGTGTSDSILAWHQSMGPIRVSNGESIITAEGTRKHRKLLQAINDNTLPAFAGGMVADVAYPSIPSAGALRAPSAPPAQYFDLRGAVVTEELYRQMHQIGAAHAARALAASPAMAMGEMAEINAQRIP